MRLVLAALVAGFCAGGMILWVNLSWCRRSFQPVAFGLAVALVAGAAAADESPPCTSLDHAQRTLADVLHEHPVEVGLSGSAALLLLVSEDGHFTLLAVDDDGKACMAAMGVGWHALKAKGEGE